MRRYATCVMAMLLLAASARALDADDAQKLYDRVAPSLVAVQYTFEGEFGRREFTGAGLIVGEEGLVMAPLGLFPLQIPDEQMKEFRILVPGDEDKEVEAVFLGRDERSDVAFLKSKAPQKWKPLKFEDVPLKVGQTVLSVGLLPKEAGYKPYFAEAFVSSLLRGPVPQVLVSPGGLAGVGSPVFSEDGKAIGIVHRQENQSVLLSDTRNPFASVNSPPRMFVPARDFLGSLASPPVADQPLRVPWLGAVLTGVRKDVAEYFSIKGQPVAQVGDVVPKSPAAKAGLKTGDMILRVNGQALERGDEPEEVPMILLRKLRRMPVAAKVTLSVLRQKGAPLTDVAVTLEEQPRQAHQAKRFYAEDLGFSVREIVFADTYAKKLPADTKAAVVAFLRQGASAATAKLAQGDVVIEINNTNVESLAQFKSLYEQFRKDKPRESVVLVVMREGATQVIRIEPPQ